ncbi:MAG: ATP-binding cassette domain-containing protein [bacterium]|nr:ATP-binding cassette domain-containing protein [bacterium]
MRRGPSPRKAGRRLLAPEVVQTSAMDCGPATLKCLLGGFGIEVSYDRLREACQTDVDGTSIDTMEEVAVGLGLEAEQVMLPPDHLLHPEARALPAILVVRNPIGVTHFIVLWRCHGPWLQIMDPAIGRRWVGRELLEELYVHRHPVGADAWRAWAGAGDFPAVLRARMKAIGIGTKTSRELLTAALEDPGWRALATLDAAVRMTAALGQSGGLPLGKPSAALVRACVAEARGGEPDADQAIPERYWSVREAPSEPNGNPDLLLHGAVLVRVLGRRIRPPAGVSPAEATEVPALSPELVAALEAPASRPGRQLLGLLRSDGLLTPACLFSSLALAAGTTVLEALFFRGLLDVGFQLVLPEQRLAAMGAFGLFLALVLLLEVPAFSGILGLGRKLELRLRTRFLERLAQLADQYLRSRLSSDMAERSHRVDKLREVPKLGAYMSQWFFQAVLTVAGIIWLDPATTPVALVALGLTLGLPLLVQPVLTERDLRVRTHAGALSRFFLDALLGLVPVRQHGAERSMQREHENLLTEWARSMLRREWAKLLVDALQAGTGYGLAIWLLFRHLAADSEATQFLLLAYWALNLQQLGQHLSLLGQQYPQYRNIALRLLEPLGVAPEEAEGSSPGMDLPGSAPAAPETTGVAIGFEGVRVVAAGHTILADIEQSIEPGSHVAIIGPSGAGKSSLLGLLLGWHRPAAGLVRVDGELLDAGRLETLRAETAWIDPAVQLWNRSLLANLCYGSQAQTSEVGGAIEAAMLQALMQDLPQGLQSPLGESGALVSGGEGQRVRLGRALLRPQARLVILDEPFRGLDRTQRRELTRRARDWWREATLLYVSHDVGETLGFDRVWFMEGGRVVESGRPGELGADPGSRYSELLAAEASVRREFMEGSGWRRLRMEEGELREGGR